MLYILNADNKKYIDNLISTEDNVVILYYSDMCGFCIQLMTTWDKLCNCIKNNKDVIIINAESNNINHLKAKYRKDIAGYPTIIKFNKGKKINEYNGNRELADMKKFVKKV